MTPLKHRFARALSALAALALPALAAAPIDASTTTGLRPASIPAVDIRHARVIVKFKADGALMRESAQSARDPDRVAVQHAARLSQRLGITLRDGRAIAPRTQVLHAKNMSSARFGGTAAGGPRCRICRDRRAHAHHRGAQRPTLRGRSAAQHHARRSVSGTCARPTRRSCRRSTPRRHGTRPRVHPRSWWRCSTPACAQTIPIWWASWCPAMTSCRPIRDGSFTSSNDGNGRDADASDPGDWVTRRSRRAGGPRRGLRRRRQQLARHADVCVDRRGHQQRRRHGQRRPQRAA